MGLGLGASLTKGGLTTPGIVTDNLVLKHNYSSNGNIPVSDGAAYFDGTNHIQLALPASTFYKNFTITAWVWRHTEAAYNTILGATDSTLDRITLYVVDSSAGNSNKVILAQGPEHEDESGGAVTDLTRYAHGGTVTTEDGWMHIAATSQPGAQALYNNGVNTTANDYDGSFNLNISATVAIGAQNGGGGSDFLGYMCNIGIWTRVLSQGEIKNVMWKNYAGLNTQEKQDLAAWYNLDSEVGSDGNAGSGYVLDEHSGAGSTTNLGTLEA